MGQNFMEGTFPEIMTVHEAAEFLRVPLSTIYMLAQGGKIPSQKVGRHWRFNRTALANWIAGQNAGQGEKPIQE